MSPHSCNAYYLQKGFKIEALSVKKEDSFSLSFDSSMDKKIMGIIIKNHINSRWCAQDQT